MRPYQRIAHLGELARGGRCFVIEGFDDTLSKDFKPPAPPTVAAGSAGAIDFSGIRQPGSDFQAVRDGRRSTLLGYLVDLSSARSIAAGTALTVPLEGNVLTMDPLYDLSGNSQAGIARVHFQDTNLTPPGTYVTVLPNAIYHVPFTQVLIENFAQPGKFAYLVYGVDIDLAPGQSQQVQILGTVTVARATTYENAAVDADKAWGIFKVVGAGGAGNTSVFQIKNPAASGKTVYVDHLSAIKGTAGNVNAWLYDVDLTTLDSVVVNKHSGGAAMLTQQRSQNGAAFALGTPLLTFATQTGNFADFTNGLKDPIRLDAGKGVVVYGSGAANESILVNAAGREI